MRQRHLQERPSVFRLNNDCALAQGLVFAGLGRVSGSTHYRDSSLYGNHGALTNMEATDWLFDGTLGRWVVNCRRVIITAVYIGLPTALDLYENQQWTISGIIKRNTTTHYDAWIGGDAANTTNRFAIGDGSPAYLLFADNASSVFLTASPKFVAGIWNSLVLTCNGSGSSNLQCWLNGVAQPAVTLTGSYFHITTIGGHRVGTSAYKLDGLLGDVLIHNRLLSAFEIQQLADPSNVMLSGLILAPKRRVFPGYTFSTTTTKKRFFTLRGVKMSCRY